MYYKSTNLLWFDKRLLSFGLGHFTETAAIAF